MPTRLGQSSADVEVWDLGSKVYVLRFRVKGLRCITGLGQSPFPQSEKQSEGDRRGTGTLDTRHHAYQQREDAEDELAATLCHGHQSEVMHDISGARADTHTADLFTN